MSIASIIEKYPETSDVFAANGMAEDIRNDSVPEALLLGTFAGIRNINEKLFIGQLEKIAESQQLSHLYTEDAPPCKPDFLGYVVCPIKHLYKEGYEESVQRHYDETGERFVSFVPMGCGGPDPYEEVWDAENEDELPDMIASVGFGSFYRTEFRKKFLEKGIFTSVQPQPVPEPFASAGLADPKGWYTIYSVFTYIMLVDFKKLGDLPVPESWGDLLNPVYEKNIIIGGSDDAVNEVLLMNIFKDFGEEGLRKLAPNIKEAWHASQMAKAAGSSMSKGAAIYILPWFFAMSCPNTEHTKIVWPKDGALASPMYLLVKKSARDRLKPVIDFMTGTALGEMTEKSYFPTLLPVKERRLPADAKIKWIGWDFIHSHDMKTFSDELNERFMNEYAKIKEERATEGEKKRRFAVIGR
jgi:ABC-type Fe3+ transport system substrate-binding protein